MPSVSSQAWESCSCREGHCLKVSEPTVETDATESVGYERKTRILRFLHGYFMIPSLHKCLSLNRDVCVACNICACVECPGERLCVCVDCSCRSIQEGEHGTSILSDTFFDCVCFWTSYLVLRDFITDYCCCHMFVVYFKVTFEQRLRRLDQPYVNSFISFFEDCMQLISLS